MIVSGLVTYELVTRELLSCEYNKLDGFQSQVKIRASGIN